MSRDMKMLIPEFRDTAQTCLDRCSELGVEMRPFYTLRTPREQARLWRQSRPRPLIDATIEELHRSGAPFLAESLAEVGPQNGRHVTNALPGMSWHQWGEALDCYWLLEGDAEWSTRKQIRLQDGRDLNGYRLYGETARDLGLTSGGFWSRLKDWAHLQKRPRGVRSYYSLPEIDALMKERFDPAEP